MPLPLLVGVACALLFHRAADHERMSPLMWGGASVLLTAGVVVAGRGVGAILLVQAGLFLVMWWYNASRRHPR